MTIVFLNNFSTVTVNPLAPADTTLELQSGFSDVKAAVDSGDTLVLTLFETNESGEETGREIVHVTAADGQAETLTIERGKEGTAGGDWGPNTSVEQRLTAGALQDSFDGVLYNNATDSRSLVVGDGDDGGERNCVLVGDGTVAGGDSTTAIGYQAEAAAEKSVALGSGITATAKGGVTIGGGGSNASKGALVITPMGYTYPNEDEITGGIPTFDDAAGAVVLGAGATIDKDSGSQYGYGEIVIGFNASTAAEGECVVVGADGYAMGDDGNTAIGPYCGVFAGAYNLAGGYYSEVGSSVGGVALGCGAETSIAGGLRIPAISYLPDNPTPKGFMNMMPSAATRSASQVVIETNALDLTTVNDVQTLSLPANTMLFVDSLEVVVTGSDTPGGTPEIQVGTDAGTPADLLAATAVGKTAVGGREKHAPLTDDGITTIRAEVTTTGTGTTYQARVIVKGYVMEI